uniref:Uncharacterized protein n=1 Tax=Graphocephala atropunctata TaxID=36148 RepID=A0A1B6MKE4_9HEMI
MSVAVLLLICLHHVIVHSTEYTGENNLSTDNVSNTELIQDHKLHELATDKTITDNNINDNTSTETHISEETNDIIVKTSTNNVISSEKTNNETVSDYIEAENSSEIHVYPYTDRDGLTDVVADNGIKYESSASDNFVLPGHDDDEGNFAGITDDSEPMHYYISEEGDVSGRSDAIGIEVLLPDYVKPTRKSDDYDVADSGETTTVDEDLILPDSESVETTTIPTTEATTWFYHSWEFRGENFEIKEDEITTVKPFEQEYVDEDEQTPDLMTIKTINLGASEETATKSQKLGSQIIEDEKYEQEDTDDIFDYKNLMTDDSQDMEQTTDAVTNKKNMEQYVISFDKHPVKVISYKSSNNIGSQEGMHSKKSNKNSGHFEIPTLSHSLKKNTDNLQLEKNQLLSKRTKRENEELKPKFQEEENEDEQEVVTESVVPETTRIWRWPTHSWENHGDMYEPSSPETTTEIPIGCIRSNEEMEYSEEDISVADNDNTISFSGRQNLSEHKPSESVLFELNKDGNYISDGKNTHSPMTGKQENIYHSVFVN